MIIILGSVLLETSNQVSNTPSEKEKKCPFLNYRDHCPKYIPIIVEMFEAHPKSSPFDMFHSDLKPPTCKKKRKIFQKILLNGSK
jgi:hypothetical protein